MRRSTLLKIRMIFVGVAAVGGAVVLGLTQSAKVWGAYLILAPLKNTFPSIA
jgi:hypothetical protein